MTPRRLVVRAVGRVVTRSPWLRGTTRSRHYAYLMGTWVAAAALLPAAAIAGPAVERPTSSATDVEAESEEPDLEHDPILEAEAPSPPPAARPIASPAGDASTGLASQPVTEGEPALLVPAAITGGLGVLGMIMFAGFGGASQATYAQLEDECRDGHCPPELADDAAAARAEQAIANTAVVCGATLLVAGGVLLALSQWDVAGWFGGAQPEGVSSAALSLGPGSVVLHGRF